MKIGGISVEAIKYFLKAILQARAGNIDEAINSIKKSIEIEPEYYEAKFFLARLYSDMKRYEEAMKLLNEILEKVPNFSRAWGVLGDIYDKLGDHDKATEYTQKAREISGKADDFVRIGNELEAKGKLEEALEKYLEATKTDASFPSAWYNVAHIYERLNNLEKALEYFDRVVRLQPDDIFAWNKRIGVLKKLNKYDEALQSYDIMLEIDPSKKLLWYWRAKTAEEAGKFDIALECSEKLLELDPNDTFALQYKAQLCEKLGKIEEALKTYEKILEIEPQNIDALIGLSKLYAEHLNKVEEALKCIDKAIQIDPDKGILWYHKGLLLLKLGDEDKSLECLEKAVKIDMMLTDALIKLAELYEKKGWISRAFESFEMLTKIRASDPHAWYLRAQFLMKHERLKDALKCVNRALQLDPTFVKAKELKEEIEKKIKSK